MSQPLRQRPRHRNQAQNGRSKQRPAHTDFACVSGEGGLEHRFGISARPLQRTGPLLGRFARSVKPPQGHQPPRPAAWLFAGAWPHGPAPARGDTDRGRSQRRGSPSCRPAGRCGNTRGSGSCSGGGVSVVASRARRRSRAGAWSRVWACARRGRPHRAGRCARGSHMRCGRCWPPCTPCRTCGSLGQAS
jgi:hypothetical protein